MSGEALHRASLRRRWLMLAVVFAVLALPVTVVARGPDVLPGDTDITRAIQAWPSPALDTLALAFTAIGSLWPGEPLVAAAIVTYLTFAAHDVRRPLSWWPRSQAASMC